MGVWDIPFAGLVTIRAARMIVRPVNWLLMKGAPVVTRFIWRVLGGSVASAALRVAAQRAVP